MSTEPPKTVAVIGASSDRSKFGNKGTRAFVKAGWWVFPVNPKETTIEGLHAVADLADIAGDLDVVSLYVPAEVSLAMLPAIAAKGPEEVWINPGAESRELLAAAKKLGLITVETCSIVAVGYRPADFP